MRVFVEGVLPKQHAEALVHGDGKQQAIGLISV